MVADLGIAPGQRTNVHPDAMPLGHVEKTDTPIHMFVFIDTDPAKDHVGMRDGLGDVNSLTRTKILDSIQTFSTHQTVSISSASANAVVVRS